MLEMAADRIGGKQGFRQAQKTHRAEANASACWRQPGRLSGDPVWAGWHTLRSHTHYGCNKGQFGGLWPQYWANTPTRYTKPLSDTLGLPNSSTLG